MFHSDQPTSAHLRNVIAKYNLDNTYIGRDWNPGSTSLVGRIKKVVKNKIHTGDNLSNILSAGSRHWRDLKNVAKYNLENTNIGRDWNPGTSRVWRKKKIHTDYIPAYRFGSYNPRLHERKNKIHTDDLNPLDYAAIDLASRRLNVGTPKAYHAETDDQDSSEDTIDEHGGDVETSSCCDTANESIKHQSHYHELKLSHVLHDNDEAFNRNCSGCLDKLTSSTDPHYYYCSKCDYSLHKLCATLPETKKHQFDTKQHALIFNNEPPHEYGQTKCSCCGVTWSNFTYSCLECKIDLDIKCATAGEHKMKHWLHPHELTLLSGDIVTNCFFCGREHKGSFFHCTTCEKPNSWIHSQCAQYPKRLPFQSLPKPSHEHILELSHESHVLCDVCTKVIKRGPRYKCTQCRYNEHSRCEIPQPLATEGPKHEHPIELSDVSDISCDICKEDIANGSPRYNCTDKCRYNVHTTCAISAPVRTTAALYVEYEKSSELVPNLPFPDNSYSLVKHYFTKLESKAREINPFIHHHQLVLFNQVAEETGLSLSGVLIKLQMKYKLTCKLCGQLITQVPFYRCPEECCLNFLVHEWCAYLPTMLEKSPCHTQHPLILQPKYSQLTGCLGLFKCDVCDLWCDGFSFNCYECDFHVDINCAFLLKNIKHSVHPLHPLRFSPFRMQNKLTKCVACSVELDDGIFVYQCFKCNFFIHTECSLLPREMKHRYVKKNYKLTYSPPRTNLEYFCDICEEKIDTNQWFYDCDRMAVSVHAAFGGCVKPYNKVLRLIRIGNHPHGFSLIATKQETICAVCQKPVSTFPFFKCSTCGISVDNWCVPEMICKSTEDALTSHLARIQTS